MEVGSLGIFDANSPLK